MIDQDSKQLGLDPEFEDRLRQALPGIDPPEEHQRRLWAVLQGNFERRPPWYRRPVPGLAVLTLSLFAIGLVAGNFGLKLIKTHPDGTREYESVAREQAFITSDSSVSQEALEGISELRALGGGILKKAAMYTVNGKTFISLTYEYEVDGQTVVSGWNTDLPQFQCTQQHIAFMQSHGAELHGMIADGSATYIGEENIYLEGYPITLRKWRADFPGWETVVYGEGEPLLSPGS